MPTNINQLSQEEQRNFEFLRERRLAQVAALLIEERGMDFNEAFRELYNSETYEILSDPRSGFYIQSARYIYSYLEKELNTGRLEQ